MQSVEPVDAASGLVELEHVGVRSHIRWPDDQQRLELAGGRALGRQRADVLQPVQGPGIISALVSVLHTPQELFHGQVEIDRRLRGTVLNIGLMMDSTPGTATERPSSVSRKLTAEAPATCCAW